MDTFSLATEDFSPEGAALASFFHMNMFNDIAVTSTILDRLVRSGFISVWREKRML
jgi:hypothetical protein